MGCSTAVVEEYSITVGEPSVIPRCVLSRWDSPVSVPQVGWHEWILLEKQSCFGHKLALQKTPKPCIGFHTVSMPDNLQLCHSAARGAHETTCVGLAPVPELLQISSTKNFPQVSSTCVSQRTWSSLMATSCACTDLDHAQPCGPWGKKSYLVLEEAGGLQWQLRDPVSMGDSHVSSLSPWQMQPDTFI